MSNHTHPESSSQLQEVVGPYNPRLGLGAPSTLYQQPPHRSSPGVRPTPHHTTLLWQNPSLPRSAQLLSWSRQPVGDKMPRVRDSSTSTAKRGLKLGQLWREEGGKIGHHQYFMFQINKTRTDRFKYQVLPALKMSLQ